MAQKKQRADRTPAGNDQAQEVSGGKKGSLAVGLQRMHVMPWQKVCPYDALFQTLCLTLILKVTH